MDDYPKNYYYNRWLTNLYLIVSILFLVLIFISYFVFKYFNIFTLFLCMLVLLTLYFLERKHIVLSIFEDYFVLKPYSFGSSFFIKNDELQDVQFIKNCICIKSKNFKSNFKIKLNLFNAGDRKNIEYYFKTLISQLNL